MIRSSLKFAAAGLLCLPFLVSALRSNTGPSIGETPRSRADILNAAVLSSPLDFQVTDYDLRGVDLARRQIARGLRKKSERFRRRDQSFQGLRDVIRDSGDGEIQKFLPVVDGLETAMRHHRNNGHEASYVEGFIKDFAPLALYLEHETGLPASVMLAQIIVESGWGASNITILKNNILGIGNCDEPGEFVADVDFRYVERDIRVRCMADTTAYQFDSVGESILYYTYLLLENEQNEVHYDELRKFIRENQALAEEDPGAYRDQVIELIARGYHADPAWYEGYLRKIIRTVDQSEILPEIGSKMTVIPGSKI